MVQREGDYTTRRVSPDAAEDYDYVTVSGHLQITIDDGDVLSNKLYDITNSGAHVTIMDSPAWRGTPSDNYELRNLGFKGTVPSPGEFTFSLGCRTEALVDNIYLGDGAAAYPVAPSNHHRHPGGIIVAPRHRGTLHFRGINTQNWCDNAMYCSAPGDVGGKANATVIIENCYSTNNMVTCYRFGQDDQLINSYGRIGPNDQRVVWSKYGSACDLTIDGCELEDAGGATAIQLGSGTITRVKNTSYSNTNGPGQFVNLGGNDRSPSSFMPAGCPSTPEEAASGSVSGDPPGGPGGPGEPSELDPLAPVDPSPYNHTGVVRSLTSNQNTEIELWFETTEAADVEWTTDYGANLDWTEVASDSDHNGWVRAAGAVYGVDGTDDTARKAFRSNAAIQAIRFNQANLGLSNDPTGEAQLEVDGEIVNPDSYPKTPEDEPPDPTDPDLQTGDSSNVTTDSATVTGAIHSLGDHNSLTVGFQIKERTADAYHDARTQEVTGPTNISQDFPTSGYTLTPGTLYDYRIFATEGYTGNTRAFQTASETSEPSPTEPTDAPVGSLWYIDADEPDHDVFTTDS